VISPRRCGVLDARFRGHDGRNGNAHTTPAFAPIAKPGDKRH
jgi:hypothetical protein